MNYALNRSRQVARPPSLSPFAELCVIYYIIRSNSSDGEESDTNPDVQSPKERDDGAIDQLCGQLQQLRYSHSLPTELLLNIVECFRLPVQDVASTLPAPEFLVNRKVLYNLCLTSSVFNDLATPLLYQTVIFFIDSRDYDDYLRALAYGGPRSLIMLVRTLLSKEDYCKHIENIICPGSLKPHDWGIPDNIEREVTR